MTSIPYDIELKGIDVDPGTIDAIMLRDVLDALITVAGRALRLSAEGISSRPGPRPSWVTDSLRFVLRDIREGSTVLPIEVAPLRETARAVIQQQDLWIEKPSPDDTALSLLRGTVEDVEREDRDSERYDRGVLQALVKFDRILKDGESIHIKDRRRGKDTFSLTHQHIEQVQSLKQDIPAPRGVVVSGTLTMIEHTDRGFCLVTKDKKRVRGSVQKSAVSEERLRNLWGKDVTLQGQAHVTASGLLRFIEARVIRPYREQDRFFMKSKKDIEADLANQQAFSTTRKRFTGAGQAIQEFRGSWPGDESIDEILKALD